ncbi:hypothetical protein J3R83DRAFT_13802, partial [Lanmaoa asiatica]
MSFLVGSLAGAVATGGVSRFLISFRAYFLPAARHDTYSLHLLSEQLADASATIPGPLPASARIVERPFTTMLQSRWNEHVANVFSTVEGWERRASDWTRKVLYGEA